MAEMSSSEIKSACCCLGCYHASVARKGKGNASYCYIVTRLYIISGSMLLLQPLGMKTCTVMTCPTCRIQRPRANTDLSLTSRFWRRCQRARNGWKLRGGVIQQVASLVITADQPSEQHVPRAPFGSCTRSHTVVVSDTPPSASPFGQR